MKTAIVLGTFDGLHEGHRAVIKEADGFSSVAVTFDIPPKNVISGNTELLILPTLRILGCSSIPTLARCLHNICHRQI